MALAGGALLAPALAAVVGVAGAVLLAQWWAGALEVPAADAAKHRRDEGPRP